MLLATLAFAASALAGVVPPLKSGIDTQYIDRSIRPQDDFYRYVNGGWLDKNPIPPDGVRVSAASQVNDVTRQQLRAVIEGALAAPKAANRNGQKIALLYSSFMNEAAAESQGLRPIQHDFAQIDAIRDASDLAELIGRLGRSGVIGPIGCSILNDKRDASRYVESLHQAGLGLPGREYYLSDERGLAEIRAAYLEHVRRMLALAGDRSAESDARLVVDLEKKLAQAQWSLDDSFDPVKTDNRMTLAELHTFAPGFDWKRYFTGNGTLAHADLVMIDQPSYFAELARSMSTTPIAAWKVYIRYHLLRAYAPYLGKAFVDEDFAFEAKELRGVAENSPRWKRGIDLVEQSMGEGLGELYVAGYASPQAKPHLERIFRNFVMAFDQGIAALDWMSPETRVRAREKLVNVRAKIGYPDHWRDYRGLEFDEKDLVGNVRRARTWEYERNIGKLGKPVDRDEWYMTPQTPDAYEWLPQNEIVIGAALLQPPFFDADADDAVNYGAIGGTIGHELSHGFDNVGSQYDASGKMLGKPGWFTPADQQRFDGLTRALVAQYAAFEPLSGYRVNGEQTLSENIADVAGAAIAYRAYHLSLGGKPAPVIDGLTGDQRFFMAWAQRRRGNYRDKELIRIIKSDEHSPPAIRAVVPLMNLDAFYDAFGIKPGDKMYLPPEKRIRIW